MAALPMAASGWAALSPGGRCLHATPFRKFRRLRGSSLPVAVALGLLVACLAVLHGAEEDFTFAKAGGHRKGAQQEPEAGVVKSPSVQAAAGLGLLLVLALGFWVRHRGVQETRRLKRPYQLRDLDYCEEVADPQGELTRAIAWLQDTVILPIDKRLPGRPFEYDLQYFPCKPTVLIIGNHSSGKSTFINRLMGVQVQETGVAPTDDGFTVLERHPDSEEFEDGPTLMSCSENRAFRDLQRFGRAFSGHFRRKRLVLPQGAVMPFGLQLVDTPGMIDLPGNNQATNKARGYNFVDVVRWWAKRSDLILLLFDPDKPGTTGETLEVLTKSLAGLDHKFLVVLNKVDQLDNNVDFARAYGTLGWALSKVIPQKDIPMIWAMYNERDAGGPKPRGSTELQLEAFQQNRWAVVREVLRAKVRHWDNVVTSFEECLRQIEMVARVSAAVRNRLAFQMLRVWGSGLAVLAAPLLAVAWVLGPGGYTWPGPRSVLLTTAFCYAGICLVVCALLQEYLRRFERLQLSKPGLNATFQKAYHFHFVHTDGEDLRTRWEMVRPRIEALLKAVASPWKLPMIERWESARIEEILEQDVWYLRQLAKLLRPPEPAMPGSPAPAAHRKVKEQSHKDTPAATPDDALLSSEADALLASRRRLQREDPEPRRAALGKDQTSGASNQSTEAKQQRREARLSMRRSALD